jgi:N-acetylglucosaminyldiphosphoundecaprenol N-acetyl-beta-D-mannosaminyltransferase
VESGLDSRETRVTVLDTSIDRVDMGEACGRIHEFIQMRVPQQVVTVNLDFLRLAVKNPSFRQLINSSTLVVADGMPLVWASRLLGHPVPERVAGVDLVVECSRLAARHGYRVFLLGAAPGVAEKASVALQARFPGLSIVGTHSPPSVHPSDDEVTLARIRAAKPDLLFVAFGAPRQEQWIRKHMNRMDIPVCIGVGGAFDMLSGAVNRAPRWMQHGGLEWGYRFLREPRRLWKRYFIHDLPMFIRLITQCSLHPHQTATIAPVGQSLVDSGIGARFISSEEVRI